MPAMQATLKSLTLLDFEQSLFWSKICKQEYLSSEVGWVVREELKKGWIRIRTFTRALTTCVTSLLKYSHLQIFKQKGDFSQQGYFPSKKIYLCWTTRWDFFEALYY